MLQGWVQIAIYVAILIALVKPMGIYMARVFSGQRVFLSPVVAPVERLFYRVLRVRPDREGQDWKGYARSLIVFSLFSWLALYLILRTQGIQPFNPEGFHSGPWDLSFNTASSFITNTNWQYYGGEATLTYFAQMTGLAVQNFALGGGRNRHRHRPDSRHRRPQRAGDRQLLGRPGPRLALHPAADLRRRRPLPRLPGRDPKPRSLHADPHPGGWHPDARPGPGRLAGGDQGARHERRRLLQHQLGLPVRELDRPHQLLRATADPHHSHRR